jgi:drug/metabolite transporter (DMT)-like permease
MRRAASPLAVWAGIVVLYFVWGSTYLGIRVCVESMPPFVMGGIRFVIAGAILVPGVVLASRGRLARPTLVQVRDSAIVGSFLLGGGMGLVAWGEQTVASGVAALLIALMPMWVGVFSLALFRDRMPRRAVAGTVIGLAGVAVLAGPALGGGGSEATGIIALLVSPMCWATGSIYATRRAVLPKPALLATGIEMLAGGLLMLLIALVAGEWRGFDPAAVAPTAWLGLMYLILVGSLVGYVTYSWLLGVATLARITTYAYVNPVVAVVLGWLLLGEAVTAQTITAAVVIVAGVALIVSATGRRPSPASGASSPGVGKVVRGAVDGEPAAT